MLGLLNLIMMGFIKSIMRLCFWLYAVANDAESICQRPELVIYIVIYIVSVRGDYIYVWKRDTGARGRE